MTAVQVFLVDDHALFRAGVRAELGDAVDVVGEAGTFNLFSGVQKSVNGYFVQLESAAGLCDAAKTAKALGLQLSNDRLREER